MKQKNIKNTRKTLEYFKKELIKQLYKDLFNLNKDLFINEEITYEFFLFNYYSLVDENINFDKPDYSGLVNKMNSIISKNILNNKINKEKNKEIEELYRNNEWELINKYKSSIEIEEKLKERKDKKEKIKKYNEDLNKQIEYNKILKNKNIQLKKEDQYLLNENEAKKELQEIKINKSKYEDKNLKKTSNKITSEVNNNINDTNEILDKDDMISKIVDRIVSKKREEKIDKILNGIRSKYYLEKKDFVEAKINNQQNIIDKIISKEIYGYQDI